MRRRTWYHLSAVDRGPIMWAVRRPPLLRTAAEPTTPRVCVSPDPAGCFAAILLPMGSAGYVYAAERRAVAPVGVWDRAVTGERWLVPPVALVLDRVVPPDTVRDIHAATWLRFELTPRRSPSWSVRLAQYIVAARVLRVRHKWAVEYFESRFPGVDPEDHIIFS